MKNRRRKILIAAALVALIGGVVYEAETHLGRGWLAGEAFYDGRPTSYWRSSLESWIGRFDSPEEAMKNLRAHAFQGYIGSTIIIHRRPRPTFLGRVGSWFGNTNAWDDNRPPKVLTGGTEARPVVRELEQVESLRRFMAQAREDGILLGE